MRFTAVSLVLALFSACSTPVRKRDRLFHPTAEEFYASAGFPYCAPLVRRKQIDRAAHRLRKGLAEAEVLHMLGQPDYKAGWRYPNLQLRGEVWHYVHSARRQTPERIRSLEGAGKVLTITLDPRTCTVIDFDAVDFGVREHR